MTRQLAMTRYEVVKSPFSSCLKIERAKRRLDPHSFEAVWEILNDYFLIRGEDAYESRLQRTVESFRKAWNPIACKNREVIELDDHTIPFISRSDLIRTKKASERPQDKIDIDNLKESRAIRCTRREIARRFTNRTFIWRIHLFC